VQPSGGLASVRAPPEAARRARMSAKRRAHTAQASAAPRAEGRGKEWLLCVRLLKSGTISDRPW
jgi:hypothetical protein